MRAGVIPHGRVQPMTLRSKFPRSPTQSGARLASRTWAEAHLGGTGEGLLHAHMWTPPAYTATSVLRGLYAPPHTIGCVFVSHFAPGMRLNTLTNCCKDAHYRKEYDSCRTPLLASHLKLGFPMTPVQIWPVAIPTPVFLSKRFFDVEMIMSATRIAWRLLYS